LILAAHRLQSKLIILSEYTSREWYESLLLTELSASMNESFDTGMSTFGPPHYAGHWRP